MHNTTFNMPNLEPIQHVYKRTVVNKANDSLGLIAQIIPQGAVVLDLGMGTGELGRHLLRNQTVTIDGVTWSDEEAKNAIGIYRKIHVADLDIIDLIEEFPVKTYDCVVCADVLEHLRYPERVIRQCRELLKPGGLLLTSVPNATYCGLVAELIQGDFKYRPEGLLDRTHLRFFTRKSMGRFFNENGWQIKSIQVTTRDILSSEFSGQFNHMPPSVASYLLAQPDADTYQFICSLEDVNSPQASSTVASILPSQQLEPALPLFSSELYLAVDGQYDESRKCVRAGTMGGSRQTLKFHIPALAEGKYTQLRLDPADRPGFMRLSGLRLFASQMKSSLWDWNAKFESHSALEKSPQQQIWWHPILEPKTQGLLQLLGNDPWIELPIKVSTLETLTREGGHLEIVCTWPMSADYMQSNQEIQRLQNYILDSAEINSISNNAKHPPILPKQQLQQVMPENMKIEQESLNLNWDAAYIEEIIQKSQRQLQEVENEKSRISQDLALSKKELLDALSMLQQNQIQLEDSRARISRIEASKLFRWSRPLAQMKYNVYNRLGLTSINTQDKSGSLDSIQELPKYNLPLPTTPVDIIIPVYRGLEDTQRCIQSALASRCKTDWHLLVINDCSPEPEVSKWLREIAANEPRITLLENPLNLGFVATVNRGMSLHADRDVLLLNSDTEVASDWLDRIQRAAYAQPQVATVTPFSNNATICSYPRFCQANDLPAGFDLQAIDNLCSTFLTGQSCFIPTAHGFCMYIRRDCLKAVGLFDVENFGKGYGEENDFSLRASSAGWQHVHAWDVFVKHAGGVSFGATKSSREEAAMKTIRRLHPGYEALVHSFISHDPAGVARLTLDIARITQSSKPIVLFVSHNREGGTLRHIRDYALQSSDKQHSLLLRPVEGGGVSLTLAQSSEPLYLSWRGEKGLSEMVDFLVRLGLSRLEYHHWLGHDPWMLTLGKVLNVPTIVVLHDYYALCPQLSMTNETNKYCGELGEFDCQRCLKINPTPELESIQLWRQRHEEFLHSVDVIAAPSKDVAQRFQRYWPSLPFVVAPHEQVSWRQVRVRPLAANSPLKVVILGALSPIKGADVLEEVAIRARELQRPLEFHLFGYSYRKLATRPKSNLTVHGAYEENELAELLAWLKPDIAWFPTQCPETYSYTLSACLQAELPIIAGELGAIAQRIEHRPQTWLHRWDSTTDEWLKHLEVAGAQLRKSEGLWEWDDTNNITSREQLAPLGTANNHSKDSTILIARMASSATKLGVKTHPNKHLALDYLSRLRSTPILSNLVKRIPINTQRRIKDWLIK